MVSDFLLREFQHHLISTPDTPVIHDSEILVIDNKAVTLVVRSRRISIFFVDSVAIVILLGKHQQSLIIAFVPKFVKLSRVIRKLEIRNRRIKCILLCCRSVFLLLADILFQFLRYLIHLLGNYRGCPFHVQKRCLDELRRFLQLIEPSFEVCATVLLDMLGHAVTLCDQCAA